MTKRTGTGCERGDIILTASLILLLTLFYQIPCLSTYHHEDGVVHRSDLEHQHTGKGKNAGADFFVQPCINPHEALSLVTRLFTLIAFAEWTNSLSAHFYFYEHRCRDDLVKYRDG